MKNTILIQETDFNKIRQKIKSNPNKIIIFSSDNDELNRKVLEKLIISANKNNESNTKFICIRGGNVIGTNGSVLPLFKKQIQEKNEVTITDPTMTRYLMSTREAIGLIFEAVNYALGGEIFVMRMPSTTVSKIASIMIKLFGNNETKKRMIGVRPGEKIDEVLVSKNESPRTKIFDENYFVILPQYKLKELEKAYSNLQNIKHLEFTSKNARSLSDKEFISILKREDWLWKK